MIHDYIKLLLMLGRRSLQPISACPTTSSSTEGKIALLCNDKVTDSHGYVILSIYNVIKIIL